MLAKVPEVVVYLFLAFMLGVTFGLGGCAPLKHEQWKVEKPLDDRGMTTKIVDCVMLSDTIVDDKGNVTGAVYECTVEGW